MPSINLLPENFATETNKHRERIAVYILATLFILSSACAYVLVNIEKEAVAGEVDRIDGEISGVREEIETAMKNSDLISSDYDKGDIEKLLKNHVYYSEGLDLMKSLILQGVYMDNLEIESYDDKSTVFTFNINTDNPDKISGQIAALKDSFWVKSINFASTGSGSDENKADEELIYSADVEMLVDSEKFVFHEQYWDSGIEKLASCVNRNVKVSSYSVELKKNEKGEDESILVKFEGSVYGSKAAEDFENKLKEVSGNPEKVEFKKFNSPNNIPGVFAFRGSVTLDY